MVEVECSGEALSADRDLLTVVLFRVGGPRRRVLATANLKSGECATSSAFSACRLHARDSHRTRLATLVLDLAPGEQRAGAYPVSPCNAT